MNNDELMKRQKAIAVNAGTPAGKVAYLQAQAAPVVARAKAMNTVSSLAKATVMGMPQAAKQIVKNVTAGPRKYLRDNAKANAAAAQEMAGRSGSALEMMNFQQAKARIKKTGK